MAKPTDVSFGMKVCTVCGLKKSLSEFAMRKHHKLNGVKVPQGRCKTCRNEASRKRYFKNHEKNKKYAKKWANENREKNRWLQALRNSRRGAKERGFSCCTATVGEIRKAFTGYCAICGVKEKGRRLSMDHDHSTGRFRFWLCLNCNRGLGAFGDSPELLHRAAAMLEELA